MRSDIHELKLSDSELAHLTGRENLTATVEQLLQLYVVYEKSAELFTDLQKTALIIRPSVIGDPAFRQQLTRAVYQKSLEKIGWIGRGFNTLTNTIEKKIDKYLQRFQPTPLGILLDDVDRYNRAIDEMIFLDQLQEAGNPVKIQDRQYIIERLRQIRAELVRAIKTEKLFREHPQINMNDMLSNLYSWQRLELDEQAQKYERCVNEALEIGVKVWEEMRVWYFVEDNHQTLANPGRET